MKIRRLFVELLIEFEDVFLENVIAGNCELGKLIINIKIFSPSNRFHNVFLLICERKLIKDWEYK